VLIGGEARRAAEVLGRYGLSEILHVTGEPVAGYHPEVYAEHLARLIREQGFANFLGADTARGKDLLPRVAARLEAALASDCIAIDLEAGEVVKPMYSGKVNARLKLNGEFRLYALRPNAVPAQESDATDVQIVPVDAAARTTLAEIREIVESVSKKIDLTEAQAIVSGGYGVGSAENFQVLQELADVLGAAVGASRRAVDEGLVPYEMQVGQTGKVVNPQLYIACGISGAIQHFAGMKTSRVIVAINKDPEAPIFKKSHYGIVGDLFEVVPCLTEELRKRLGK
jgi:electron transfer flavoprotein alpha subunit